MLHQIIYTSSASDLMTTDDLRKIAQQAQGENRAAGVTGILLFTDGIIFQVLEGEKNTVESLFDRISSDPRHNRVLTMISRSTTKREFPEWSMGFAEMNVGDVSELAFILTKDTLAAALPAEPTNELRVLSSTYARVNAL